MAIQLVTQSRNKIIWLCHNNFITIPHEGNLLRQGGRPLMSQGLPFFELVSINGFVW